MRTLGKYSFGVGDRFAHQGEAQLAALIKAKEIGIDFTPVWNKSNREHTTVSSNPKDTRIEADAAVAALKWEQDYFVDADHINMSNVDWFIESSDFFTLDVADYIGEAAGKEEMNVFIEQNKKYVGELWVPGIKETLFVDEELLTTITKKFLFAIKKASIIYFHINAKKGSGTFVAEVSMDEVEEAQTPIELFFILSAISFYNIPAQTIAPKFTGRFNKGVDYVGDLNLFKKEFEEDLLVIDYAIKEFNLPENLKLSIHSGSDKFSIYPIMGELIKKYDKGIHIKTAGTTWCEEVVGLAMAGGDSLQMVKDIYCEALTKLDELSKPYSTVIDIKKECLPSNEEVEKWDGEKFASSLRHIPGHENYNASFRQLIHVGYRIAASYADKYTNALRNNKELVGAQITTNIFDRHIKRLF